MSIKRQPIRWNTNRGLFRFSSFSQHPFLQDGSHFEKQVPSACAAREECECSSCPLADILFPLYFFHRLLLPCSVSPDSFVRFVFVTSSSFFLRKGEMWLETPSMPPRSGDSEDPGRISNYVERKTIGTNKKKGRTGLERIGICLFYFYFVRSLA